MKLSALALLAVLALSGCAASGPAETAEHGAEAATEHGSEASAEHGAEGEPVTYPVGFPTDRVPMFEGELLHVAHPGNLWAAWIESHDLVADLATASQLILDAGYAQTAGGEGWGEFSDADRSLRIIASVDGTYGSSLAYTITDGALEADDAGEHEAEPEPSEH